MGISKLLLMAVLHFVLMYILMYAMVNTFSNVYPSLNQLYMAGIMTTPMLILEGLLMSSMYEKKAITIVLGISTVVFITFFLFIRNQTAITDKEFLRSMIPHHAGAILMCEKADISDPEIKKLCQSIVVSQQAEIELMKNLLSK